MPDRAKIDFGTPLPKQKIKVCPKSAGSVVGISVLGLGCKHISEMADFASKAKQLGHIKTAFNLVLSVGYLAN